MEKNRIDKEKSVVAHAKILREQGKFTTALNKLKTFEKEEGISKYTLTSKAQIYKCIQQNDNATDALKLAMQLDPTDITLKKQLASHLLNSHNWGDALELFSSFYTETHHIHDFLAMTYCYIRLGRTEECRELLKDRLSQAAHPYIYRQLGICNFYEKQKDTAELWFIKACQSTKNNPSLHVEMLNHLAWFYSSTKQYNKALEQYLLAIKINESFEYSIHGFIATLIRSDQCDEALAIINKLKRKGPVPMWLTYLEARAYFTKHDILKGKKTLRPHLFNPNKEPDFESIKLLFEFCHSHDEAILSIMKKIDSSTLAKIQYFVEQQQNKKDFFQEVQSKAFYQDYFWESLGTLAPVNRAASAEYNPLSKQKS